MKNSWGETWGNEGYILLERADAEESQGGECGLLIEAVYPVLGKVDDPPGTTTAAAAASVDFLDLDTLVVREEGFSASATAVDCGGGTSEMVFDDRE